MINTPRDKNYDLYKISDHIQFSELSTFKACKFNINEDAYISIIATKETSYYRVSDLESLKLQAGSSLLKYRSEGDLVEISSSKLDSKCLFIIYSSHFIDGLGTKDRKLFQLIHDYSSKVIHDPSIILTAQELLNSTAPAYLRNIEQKSKVLEIFLKQLAFISNPKGSDLINLRQIEMQKVERAKKLIDDNISNTYTIIELSKMIGTNEQYLKQYFKQQYGMTIRTYILKNKMNHAKELLINGNDKVAVIATKIGYKHATHFTTAFKKYFGFLPNSIRFNWLAYLSPYSLELLCTI